jgi:copper chaperone CopZ
MGIPGMLILKVRGMHCKGCEERIQKVLTKVPGVTKVEADHTNGKVRIRITSTASEDEIKEKVSYLGYEVL